MDLIKFKNSVHFSKVMGQAELVEYLNNNPNSWYLTQELMQHLKLSRGAIVRILKCLLNQKLIIKKLAKTVIINKERLSKTTSNAYAYSIKKN